MGNYGVALDKKDDPNDGNGIGRVVREIKKDGSFGPIYFIYYNHAFNEKNTSYPYFKRSKDKEFVKACQEILDNPRYRMQWVEEADRNDPLIPLHKEYKAYCDYTLPDGRGKPVETCPDFHQRGWREHMGATGGTCERLCKQ